MFSSVEWIDAFCDELAAHPRAAHAAVSLGGVYRFVVDPAGPLPHQRVYAVSLGDRRWRRRRDACGSGHAVAGRRLDLGRAMLFGRVRITGDLGALPNARSALDVLVDALRAFDTAWLETAT